MKIKKRIIFSRHGLRYPLFYHESLLKIYGKDIINWDFPNELMGHLSKKGEVIEFLFGQELKEILNLNDNMKIRVLCNSTHRTYHTSKLLCLGMNPFKEQVIDYKDKSFNKLDTRYNILFKENKILDYDKVKKIDEKLKDAYTRIEELLDLEKGTIVNKKSNIYLDDTGYLHVKGALSLNLTLVIK
ncbi:histidine phosphatase family protein [Oceanivirga salmonicida]|uniref:histidine phosphatase family protein n=1 Tax=Oceanivirga salmonicida TaxID=1769291 RepID=UPI0012E18570|nr:histidine phosphatase family protein [Oceanivirga salmonicida]